MSGRALSPVIVCAIAILGISQTSLADTIASVRIAGMGIGQQGTTAPAFATTFSVANADVFFCEFTPQNCIQTLDHTFTSSDIGQTFPVNADTSAHFALIAAQLTDGLPDTFSLWGGSMNYLFPVAPIFFPNGGGPDFRGHTIGEIDLTINALTTFQTDLPFGPTDPVTGTVPFETLTFLVEDVTITVKDTAVPEPRPAVLLVSALALAAASREWRRVPVRPHR